VKKMAALFALIGVACVPVKAQNQPALRVNCGGLAYTDAKGQAWQADNSYNGGNTSNVNTKIAGTADLQLYQTDRYASAANKPIIYSFPVSAGSYHVNLYFAETFSGTQKVGARVFSVKVQGNPVFQNLDIYAAAGGNTALMRSTDAIVTTGPLTIELDSVVQMAKINAIEITQSVATPLLSLNFTYPDGSPVQGTMNYKVASSATTLSGNEPLVNGQATCMMVASPALLGLIGTMNVDVSLTDTGGNILWEITVTMNPANANLGTVQSSALNVVVQRPQ
jgi:Malectin domain